jgi:4-amino-4-deoxy-L-arabinose transferase-like glycosyltransferase
MTTQTQTNKFLQSSLGLIGVILIGFAIRLYHIDTQSLWYDETVSAFLVGQSAPALIAHTARDIHPPGYYLLLHYWQGAAGHSQFALAFFSLVWGVLLIPLTYTLARFVTNHQAALWAVLLIAVSPFNIWYSQEVRMYTLGAALGLIVTYCLSKAIVHSTKIRSKVAPSVMRGQANVRSYWLGYLLASALGLYVLYYFVFLLIVLNLLFLGCMLCSVIRPTLLKPLLISNALVLAVYLPWLPIAWRQATDPPVPPWRSSPQLGQVIIESWSALSLGQSVEAASLWPVLILTLLLMVLGLSALRAISKAGQAPPTWLLSSYTFGPLLLIYLLSLITPLYHVRYLFTYSPAFYIILGAGLFWLGSRLNLWSAGAAAGLIVAASAFSVYQLHFNPKYRPDDYRAAVNFIQSRWQPGDLILINAGYTYTAFLYYAGSPGNLQRQRLLPYHRPQNTEQPLLLQTGVINGEARLGWGDPRSDFYAMPAGQTIKTLEQISRDFSRLWLLRAYDTVTDPKGLIRAWLAKHTILLEDQLFSGESNIRAQAFLLSGQPAPDQQPVYFEDGMLLAGWRLPQQNWRAGQTIPIKLWWAVSAAPGVDYKTSVKLWTPAGELAAQGQDEWPAGALYRATDWPIGQPVYHPTALKLPPDIPAGQYWLNVELYHPETIQPLPRQDTGETAVTLGSLVIGN